MKQSLLAMALLCLPAAAAAYSAPDYSYPAYFLQAGTQSALSATEFDVVKKDAGIADADIGTIAMVGKIYAWLAGPAFDKSKSDGGASIGKNTASGLLSKRELYGCTDWALLVSSILRAAGTPALMADTVGVGWMEQIKAKKTGIGFQGHVFVEAYVDKRWILIENNSRMYFSDYDPKNPVIPMKVGPEKKGFYAMRKGVDPHDYGIAGVQELNALMTEYAGKNLDPISWPSYTAKALP